MIVRTGEPDDIPTLQAIEKKARSIYAALAGFEFVAASPPIGADRFTREPPLSQRYRSPLWASPLFSRWTGRCIWPTSPFFQTPQSAGLGLCFSNG